MAEFEMIAKTFQGLEEVLAQELTELGANNIQIGNRMVSFTGDKALMYKANFHLRTAIRILKPFKHFKAASADEVYDVCKKIEWEKYMDNLSSFAVDAVVNSEEFTHSKFVAYRVKDAIADYFREKEGHRPNVSVANPDITFHIHISNEDCSLSLDSSGESLHRRGYRQDTMEAPLNEVLAAGMILMTGWRGECDFVDPMCGSGTLPIEAALIARNMAPGLFRSQYAFEKWKDFDRDLFEQIYNDDSAERPFNGHIYGYDKDAKAILTAKRNAKAAGLLDTIHFDTRDVKDFQPITEKTLMVTNPPYGERLREGDIPELYATLGERLKHAFTGGEAWVICNHYEYFDKIGLKPSAKVPLYNGALACEFRKYEIFGGKYESFRSEGEHLRKEDSSTRRGTTLRHKAAQAERLKKDGDDAASDGERRERRPGRPRREGFGKDGERRSPGRSSGRDGFRSSDRPARPYSRRDKEGDESNEGSFRKFSGEKRPYMSFKKDGDAEHKSARRFSDKPKDGSRKGLKRNDGKGYNGKSSGSSRKPYSRSDKSFSRSDKPFGRKPRSNNKFNDKEQ